MKILINKYRGINSDCPRVTYDQICDFCVELDKMIAASAPTIYFYEIEYKHKEPHLDPYWLVEVTFGIKIDLLTLSRSLSILKDKYDLSMELRGI